MTESFSPHRGAAYKGENLLATRTYIKARTVTAWDGGTPYNYTIEDEVNNLEWRNSPRVNGKLLLRGNPMTRNKSKLTSFVYQDAATCNVILARYYSGRNPFWIHSAAADQAVTGLYNECYARLRGKLYKGSASLGVTLGSAKQSGRMINDRFLVLNNKAVAMSARLGKLPVKTILKARDAKRFRELPKAFANAYLEIIFGWVPLMKDIHAAGHALASIKPDYQVVKAKASGPFRASKKTADGNTEFNGSVAVTLALGVSVSNPNAWMLERLGLLNPGAVAWDLVPWSFVVNMFVNTGQLMNSLTDFTGLTFDSDGTFTKSIRGSGYERARVGHKTSVATWVATPNIRTLIAKPPTPRLSFRMPDTSISNAALAAALFTQRFQKIAGFFNPNLTK